MFECVPPLPATGDTKILPSPISPVLAAEQMILTTASTWLLLARCRTEVVSTVCDTLLKAPQVLCVGAAVGHRQTQARGGWHLKQTTSSFVFATKFSTPCSFPPYRSLVPVMKRIPRARRQAQECSISNERDVHSNRRNCVRPSQ